MENRVGDKLPSEAELAKLERDVESLIERVGKFGVALTTEERQQAVKPRLGWEDVVRTLAGLVSEHDVSLPGIDKDAMLADLTLAQRVSPLAQKTEQLAQLVADTQYEARHEAWWAATAFYTALNRTSGSNASLTGKIKPLVEFFAIGRRKKAALPQK